MNYDPNSPAIKRMVESIEDYEAGRIKAIPASSFQTTSLLTKLWLQATESRTVGEIVREAIAANNPGIDVEAAYNAICDSEALMMDDGKVAWHDAA